MSWSVSASGKPSEVRGQLSEQFKGPLAEKPQGLADDGERELCQRVSDTIEQVLSTIDEERTVTVSASGSMGYADTETKASPYHNVTLNIQTS